MVHSLHLCSSLFSPFACLVILGNVLHCLPVVFMFCLLYLTLSGNRELGQIINRVNRIHCSILSFLQTSCKTQQPQSTQQLQLITTQADWPEIDRGTSESFVVSLILSSHMLEQLLNQYSSGSLILSPLFNNSNISSRWRKVNYIRHERMLAFPQ